MSDLSACMDTMQAMSILQINADSDPNAIKAAYRRLVLEHHPDRKSGDDIQFKRITEAYHTLTKQSVSSDAAKKPADAGAPPKTGPSNRAKWGAGPTDKIPEEDWGRYTAEFEEYTAWWKAYEDRFWKEYEGRVRGRMGAKSEQAREPRAQPRLRVDVDQSLCIGCCSCETIAPNVFEINRNAKSNPKSSVKDSRGAGVNRIMNAAETCPTKAIVVENVATGEQMYPF